MTEDFAADHEEPVASLLAVLDDPSAGRRRLPRLVGLLDAHEATVRIGAAWAICHVAVECPDTASYLTRRLTDRLADDAAALEAALAFEFVAVAALEGVSGFAFLLVGFTVGRRGTSALRVQGTVVDTLLRHLLPVLLFASLVPIAELAVVAGLERVIVLHIQVVFVIMTATALMTATIKLRQNLAGL